MNRASLPSMKMLGRPLGRPEAGASPGPTVALAEAIFEIEQLKRHQIAPSKPSQLIDTLFR